MDSTIEIASIGDSQAQSHGILRRVASGCLSHLGVGKQTRWDLTKLVGGTSLGRLLLLLSTPIVTRLYGLESFGVLGLFVSIVSIASVCATAKYDFAIVSAKTKSEALHLVLGGIWLALSISLSVGLVCLVLARSGLEPYADEATYECLLLLIGPTTFATATYLLIREYQVRQARLTQVAQGVVAQSGAKAASQVALGILGGGPPGLILSEVISRLMAILPYARTFIEDLKRNASRIRIRRVIASLRWNYCFPLYCLPSTLINTVALYASTPLMILCYGVETGGAFALAWSILTLPINLIGRGVSDIFHKKAAERFTRTDRSVRQLLFRTASALFLIGLVPSALLALYGERLFSWALGPECALSGMMAEAMSPWMLAQFAVTPLTQVMSVMRSYHRKLIYDFTSAGIATASILFVYSTGGPPILAILVLSALNVAAYTLLLYLLSSAIADPRPATLPADRLPSKNTTYSRDAKIHKAA